MTPFLIIGGAVLLVIVALWALHRAAEVEEEREYERRRERFWRAAQDDLRGRRR